MKICKLYHLVITVVFIGDSASSSYSNNTDNQHLRSQIEVRNFILILKKYL